MARASRNQDNAESDGFKQQDASAWISFDPGLTGHRKDVRSAAAKSSAAARKATIAKKLALNTDCSASRARDAARRSKKRRPEIQDSSPASASSTPTLRSRRQSEISLTSLASASTNSPTSSRTGSPCVTQAPLMSNPMSFDSDNPTFAQGRPTCPANQQLSLRRIVAYVFGMDDTFAQDHAVKEPTHFGALRIKSMSINSVHDAIASHRTGSGPLLAVALLSAWDLRFGDERSSLMHLRAWHQLALSQGILPQRDGFPSANVTIAEAIRISLQCHLAPDVCLAMPYVLNHAPNQVPPHQAASGREIVSFFEMLGQLVDTTGVP